MAGYKHHQQVRIGILMPHEMLNHLESFVKKQDSSFSEVVRAAIQEYLDLHN